MTDDDFERPILTVDVVLFTLIDNRLHVLLTRRDRKPYMGVLALDGGFIHTNEDTDTHAAARRVAKAKISVDVSHLEQLAVFSGPRRDPRGWSATVAYIAMVKNSEVPDKLYSEFYPVDDLPPILAFDHKMIIGRAVTRLRDKSSYSTLPLFLMPDEFTLTELQQVYEALMGEQVDKSSFRRRIKELDVIEPTGVFTTLAHHRPAELYRPISKTLYLFAENI